MTHPDEHAEHEGDAVKRQFRMPRPTTGHCRVHTIDTYGKQRKRNERESLEESFAERPRDINEHLSASMLVYMHETVAESRKLYDPTCD